MNAYAAVHEEKRGHAAGASDTEKQASQLASDVRYKARGKVKEGASDEEKKKVFMQILGASPAPQAVKAMAKQKLLGEAKVEGSMISNVSKSLVRNQRRFGDTGSTEPTGSTGQGISSAAKMSLERQKETREKRGVKTTGPQADKMNNSYEPEGEVIDEMRFNDGKEGTKKRLKALAKKRKMSMSKMKDHPQFKTEGKSYGITKGTGKTSGAMKAYLDNAKKMQKADKKKKKTGNPAFDDPSHHSFRKSQYNSHEPQGDVISEKKKESNPKNLTLPKGVKSGVDYTKTGSSTAYMGEAKKAKKDYDGDGKVESGTQEFLGSRDKAIKKAIAKKRGRVKEGFSAWRIDLDFQESVKK